MQFRVNVDHTNKRAILHRAESEDPRCQERHKKPKQGYWRSFLSIGGALAFIETLPKQLHLCGLCDPVGNEWLHKRRLG